ncbi:hypothetical protein LTR62_008764 [Meristemomyces frigidus]|uniref:Uncharacterized protein n=1 Tax=Meristemomyces frigidus TaxID=1508187 RepID=A0AAN7YN20_9PEZI|nr:hypothetical protein LTR62_008764 [Meristemomyces frigidus]
MDFGFLDRSGKDKVEETPRQSAVPEPRRHFVPTGFSSPESSDDWELTESDRKALKSGLVARRDLLHLQPASGTLQKATQHIIPSYEDTESADHEHHGGSIDDGTRTSSTDSSSFHYANRRRSHHRRTIKALATCSDSNHEPFNRSRRARRTLSTSANEHSDSNSIPSLGSDSRRGDFSDAIISPLRYPTPPYLRYENIMENFLVTVVEDYRVSRQVNEEGRLRDEKRIAELEGVVTKWRGRVCFSAGLVVGVLVVGGVVGDGVVVGSKAGWSWRGLFWHGWDVC